MEKSWITAFQAAQDKQGLIKVLDSNQYTRQYGLTLSEEDARELMVCRKRDLRAQERIEIEGGILPKLIYEFCDSPYIYQDNYVEMLEELQRIFYLYKNESLDELSDDELLCFMKDNFDGVCQGSIDYLEETVLFLFAREIRESPHGFIGGKADRRGKWDE